MGSSQGKASASCYSLQPPPHMTTQSSQSSFTLSPAFRSGSDPQESIPCFSPTYPCNYISDLQHKQREDRLKLHDIDHESVKDAMYRKTNQTNKTSKSTSARSSLSGGGTPITISRVGSGGNRRSATKRLSKLLPRSLTDQSGSGNKSMSDLLGENLAISLPFQSHSGSVVTPVVPMSPSILPPTNPSLFQKKSEPIMLRVSPPDLHINNNGITGVYLKETVVKIAYEWWSNNVDTLIPSQFMELSMLQYSQLFTTLPETRYIFLGKDIKQTAHRFFNMLGWVIRALHCSDFDLFTSLRKLGKIHVDHGVRNNHYTTMIRVLHETLADYFHSKYTVTIRYAVDRVMDISSRIMTGQDLSSIMPTVSDMDVKSSNAKIKFLASFEACVHSTEGMDYLSRFLEIELCPEIVIFLDLYLTFHNAMGDKQRLVVANRIVHTCLTPANPFEINISYTMRNHLVNSVAALNVDFHAGKLKKVSVKLFESPFYEIKKLILTNYWRRFINACTAAQA